MTDRERYNALLGTQYAETEYKNNIRRIRNKQKDALDNVIKAIDELDNTRLFSRSSNSKASNVVRLVNVLLQTSNDLYQLSSQSLDDQEKL
jgi:hypothetical protein